jgi:hypothetical protein
MDDIKSTVAAVLKDLGARKSRADAVDPQNYFAKVFEKKELRHLEFAYFRKGILAIAVDSATWLYHLSLRKQEISRKFNENCAEIKDVRFVIGEIKVAKTKERGKI